jgi:glycosyltransferase involved in cell wall biosynthesis
MRSLRILVVQNVPHHRRGGMSRMLGFLHDRVKADGHSVEFFAAEQLPPRLGGRFARFAFPLLALKHARAAARAGRPYDIINIHEPSSAAIARFKGLAGNPFVAVTSHGVEERGWGIEREDARLGRIRIGWRKRVVYPLTGLSQCQIGLRGADHVFCLNNDDKQYLRDRYYISGDRVTRLFPAADPEYAAVYRWREYSSATRLLWFGTWLPRKGIADVASAFAALVPQFPGLFLDVMGAGSPEGMVRSSFAEGLRGRINVVPAGSEEELAKRMLDSAIYLIPSLFEGTPQTMLEAMATGMPAIGTETCGMKDVIRDGVNGLLIPVRSPGDLVAAVTRLLTNPLLRERVGRQAHADVVEKYTWNKVSEPLRAIYNRVAERRSEREYQ